MKFDTVLQLGLALAFVRSARAQAAEWGALPQADGRRPSTYSYTFQLNVEA